MNKHKFIQPEINIYKFECESVMTDSVVVPEGEYAANALAGYITGNYYSEKEPSNNG